MDINLNFNETRVIGSLIEKEITTPEQYPLSLNALVNACNQKSNREPVVELDEDAVQQVLEELIRKRLVTEKSGFGSRVIKYQHRFANTEFSELQFTARELAVICVLFLRGAQTPGELRSRTSRLCEFADTQEVESTLRSLMEREKGPLVVKLPREPGKRESRYAHLFSGEVDVSKVPDQAGATTGRYDERITLLEQKIEEMSQRLERLADHFDNRL